MKWNKIIFCSLIFIGISTISCKSRQENAIPYQLRLSVNEVLIPIPASMPNDWIGIASSFEYNERLVHIYDRFSKSIIQFSLDKWVITNRIQPFSDSLNPGDFPLSLLRTDKGYYMHGGLKLGFMLIENQSEFLYLWNDIFPGSGLIKNWNYDRKFRLRPSSSLRLSMLDYETIPVLIELANKSPSAVFKDHFYEHDLFGKIDLKTGTLRRYPIRFPENFNRNGFSYPMNSTPSFTAYGESKIAFLFGIDDTIHILDTETGEVKDYTVSNPNFPINIQAVDQMTFNDRAAYTELTSDMSYYAGLYYDPFRKGLVRMGIKTLNDKTTRIYELLDEGLTIVGQFEQPNQYSPTPMFFPNEIWFPFQMGYKEDEMKLMRVRMDN